MSLCHAVLRGLGGSSVPCVCKYGVVLVTGTIGAVSGGSVSSGWVDSGQLGLL